MRTHSRSDAALLAPLLVGTLLVVSLLAAAAPRALGAGRAGAPAEPRAKSAQLELDALETRLERARSALAAIAARRAELERERVSSDRRLAVAQTALRSSEAGLAELLRALYQQSHTADPLEIVLGAGSLDEALAGLDDLDRTAARTAGIVEQTRAARRTLRLAHARLAGCAAELRRLADAAESETAELAAAVAERAAYVAELRRSTAATKAAAPAPGQVRLVVPGSTLTVRSTGYSLPGHTSSGMAAGRGVAAVDPSVIPLGTRLTVPGYGTAIAADTGPSVVGNTIDLWFPTLAEAHRWGRRTVTITVG